MTMKMIQSEWIKIRKSYPSYLIFGFTLLEIITVLPYLIVVKGQTALEAATYFPMLVLTVIVSLVSVLIYEQEEQANHFQMLRREKSLLKLWTSKIIILDVVLLLPTFFLWCLLSFIFHQPSFLSIGLVYWLLSILLVHFHLLLTLFLGNSGNLIVAFIECLLIIFATNKVFLGMYWIPVAIPVNMILMPLHGYCINLVSLLIWIVLLYTSQIYLLKYAKNNVLK
ncbi:ABC transporter permease [Streptococcus jiangjianxini]|uniref:ABC transporter permease n=1 Tax=Streptococcus jiangjianxini TaxID=3161189 RepID=UPI0032ED20FA